MNVKVAVVHLDRFESHQFPCPIIYAGTCTSRNRNYLQLRFAAINVTADVLSLTENAVYERCSIVQVRAIKKRK